MLVDKQSELMSDRFFTVHQHGGDDVTWKSGKQLNCKMESKVKINKKQCTFAKIRFPHKKHIERREEIRDSPCLRIWHFQGESVRSQSLLRERFVG